MEFLKALEGIRIPLFDKVFGVVTYLGDPTVIIAIIAIMLWVIDKKIAYKAAFSIMLGSLINNSVKLIFQIPRPWILDPSFHAVESAIDGATGFSFPSGHTQHIASFCIILALNLKNKWAKAGSVAVALLVGFTRMYLGVHTPKDVICGFIIGGGVAIIIHFVMNKIFESGKPSLVLSIITVAASIACVIFTIILVNEGSVEIKYLDDNVKAAVCGLSAGICYYIEQKYIKFNEKTNKIMRQVSKLIIGFAGVLALKEGIKLLIGGSIVANGIRYTLMLAWVLIAMPLLINLMTSKQKKES